MTPDDLYDMLFRYGVHRLQWREEIVARVCLKIGDAQRNAAIAGFVVGVVLTYWLKSL